MEKWRLRVVFEENMMSEIGGQDAGTYVASLGFWSW